MLSSIFWQIPLSTSSGVAPDTVRDQDDLQLKLRKRFSSHAEKQKKPAIKREATTTLTPHHFSQPTQWHFSFAGSSLFLPSDFVRSVTDDGRKRRGHHQSVGS